LLAEHTLTKYLAQVHGLSVEAPLKFSTTFDKLFVILKIHREGLKTVITNQINNRKIFNNCVLVHGLCFPQWYVAYIIQVVTNSHKIFTLLSMKQAE